MPTPQLWLLAFLITSFAVIGSTDSVATPPWKEHLQRGDALRKQVSYDQAQQAYQAAVQVLETARPGNTADLVTCLENLATLHSRRRRYSEAEALYERAIRALATSPGSDEGRLAGVLCNLADIKAVLGMQDQAASLYQSSLRLGEEASGVDDRSLILPLRGLARLAVRQDRLMRVRDHLKRAVPIAAGDLRGADLRLAQAVSDMGVLSANSGDKPTAQRLLGRSLDIRIERLGSEHVTTAANMADLAELYWERLSFAEAERLLERALTIREKALGSWRGRYSDCR